MSDKGKSRIDKEVEKVSETYLETTDLTCAQQGSLKDAFGDLADNNLCLVLIPEHESTSGCSELVLANKDVRSRYDERQLTGIEVDVFELRYLKSEIVPLDSDDLRRKLEDADAEVRRLGEVLLMRERAAAELRAAIAELPAPSKTPLQGQHAALRRARGES